MLDKVGMQFLAALIDSGSINEAHLLLPSLVEALIANSGCFFDWFVFMSSIFEKKFFLYSPLICENVRKIAFSVYRNESDRLQCRRKN